MRHELAVFFEIGCDRGALGTASLWKWLASMLAPSKTTAAHSTTSHNLQRPIINMVFGAKYYSET
jgi:hypothetical protein